MLFYEEEYPEEDLDADRENRSAVFLKKWKFFTSNEVWKMGKALEEEAWRNDPKMPDFLELHGENPLFNSPRELLDFLIENLKEFFREAEMDSLFIPTLAGISREAWRSSLLFRNFTIENIPIVLPPFLMVLHRGIAARISFSFRFSGKEYQTKEIVDAYGENSTLSDRLFGLFAERTFPGHTPEKWEAAFRKGRLSFHPSPITPLPLPFLLESAEKIFAFSRQEPFLSRDSFPCREEKEPCRHCRYFSLCNG